MSLCHVAVHARRCESRSARHLGYRPTGPFAASDTLRSRRPLYQRIQVVTCAAQEDEYLGHLEFPVGRHIVTGDLAKRLWEEFIHRGPYNSTLAAEDVYEEVRMIQDLVPLQNEFSSDEQDTTGNVLALCNQLSQSLSVGCYVDASYETYRLDSSDIPAQFRIPEAVKGIEFWPSQPRLSTDDHYNLLDRASSEDLLKAGDLQAHTQRAFSTESISDAFMLSLPPSSVTACTVPCEELSLLGGTIVLGEEGCLVLNGRGDTDIEARRQRLQDVIIKGGCVVCCGARCSVTFTDVQFINCSVVAVHSAKVTLNNCSFSWGGSTPASEVAIFASGSNTSVQVNGGVVNGARQGGTVCKGARFQADLWRISKEVLKGVAALAPGSQLLMRTVSFDNIDTELRSCHALLLGADNVGGDQVEATFSVSVTACRAKACLQRSKVGGGSTNGNGVAASGEGSSNGNGENGGGRGSSDSPPPLSECIVSDAVNPNEGVRRAHVRTCAFPR